MKYSKLVEKYKQLEETQSTLDKTDILAELYSENPENLESLVLLSMGRPFPDWKDLDLGISSKTMVDIIKEATGRSEDEIESVWKEKGDLGVAAEKMVEKKTQRRLMTKELTVERVMDKLEKVATMGEGGGETGSVSMATKKKEVADLVSSAEPEEAKWVTRIFLQNLRLGVAEGLVRDALAEAFFDGKNTDIIQHAYDLTNDFTEVAKACTEGVEALEELEIEVFRPINSMLAKKVDTIEEGFESVGEPAAIDYKYDGMRCISGYTPIYVKDKGIVSVRDVKKGDKVLTHKGRFKKVEAKSKRQIDSDEDVFRFSSYLGNDFKITEGHEILTDEGWINVEDLENERLVFPIPDIEVDTDKPSDLNLKRNGGYKKKIELTPEVWKIIGFWVGDGYSNKANGNQRIGLVFNEEEKERFQEYRELVKNNLKIPENELRTHSHNDGKTLYWTDPPFLRWMSKNFRKQDQSGWKDKRAPEWFWKLTEEEFRSFLDGWIEADGQKDEKGKWKNVTTKERSLATKAQLIASKHGIKSGIRKLRIDGSTYYRLVFTVSNKHVEIDGNKMKLRILKKERLSRNSPKEVDPRQKVYNLQVTDDESYCTTTVALHNCQIHKKKDEVKLFTRRLEDVTKQFPDVVEAVKNNIDAEKCIIDTEILAYDPDTGSTIPFQKLSKRIKRKYDIQKLKKEIPVEVRPFDVIYLEGSMLEENYSERWSKLGEIVEEEKQELRLVDHFETSEEERVQELQQKALSEGHEGIMMKALDARYKPGNRVGYMVKLKPVMETLDLAIIGAKWGEGRRSGWLSRLKLGCWDDKSGEYKMVGRMATGLTDEQLEEITEKLEPLIVSEDGRDVDVRPEVIVEAEYEEIQKSPNYSSGYALRFPRMKQFRDDKENADSREKVVNLYEDQN
ncbi:MAG: ATP-dependent DNA ligase [Nanohaloarchaea archaeon]|nr:ATP-dependent DNA ligase [Candidatus Nanohaloarchaea archaeon]